MTEDFNSNCYNGHPWLEYSVEDKTASCYTCKTLMCKEFVFSNWTKSKRLKKHHKSQEHGVAMSRWIAFRENLQRRTSIANQPDEKQRKEVQQNREHLRVLIEYLVLTAQQKIAQRL